ncbi:MAG: ester cyclase [Firmicutes bacterium]|nr:ester cyclase [Bacillota bacterium]
MNDKKYLFTGSDINIKICVSLNNNDKYLLSFTEERIDVNDYEIIDDYSLSCIEDGIYHLLYLYKGITHVCIIDLHKNKIEVNEIKDNSFVKNKGKITVIESRNLLTNEDKAVDFWIRFFDKHDETAIDDYLEEPYIQHNPTVEDGVDAFRNEFHERFKTDMKYCSTTIKRVLSRDNLVFIHNNLKRSPEVEGHAAVDIFRFENGKIVEHWDVIQKMPLESKNNHPMF